MHPTKTRQGTLSFGRDEMVDRLSPRRRKQCRRLLSQLLGEVLVSEMKAERENHER